MKRKKTADERRHKIITEKRKAARIQTRPEIEMLAVERLVPYAKNAKKHDDRQVAAIAGSIREFGFTNPVLIDASDGIIAGHGRVLAAQKLGLASVPCIRLAHLTDAQRRAYIIADNRLAETGGGWDAAMLAAEVESIDWEELESFGLDDMDLGEILAEAERGSEGDADAEPQVDRAEELNKTWGVKAGDLWLIGEHRLLCGDSTKAEDVALVTDGKLAGMMITDPPYNVEYEGNYIQSGKILSKPEKIWSGGIENDNRQDFSAWLSSVYSACDVALKDGAGIYIWHPPGEDGKHFWSAWPWDKWHFQVDLCWNKTSLIISRWDYKPQHELCMYGWKGKCRKWVGPNNEPTVWDIPRQQGTSGGKREHPTQKPVECMARPMRNHDATEVYDPFLGSGTTMVAGQNLGRRVFGLEISPAYCAVILQRMADAFPGIEIRKADA